MKFSRKVHSPAVPLVLPAFFCAVLPPTYSAALSHQLAHAVWLLNVVLHPRSSHLTPHGTMAWTTLVRVSEVSYSNTHALHKTQCYIWRHVQITMLPSLPLTNRTFLHTPSKNAKCEKGRSILLFSILDGCCAAITTTIPTCWSCLCYVIRTNSATCGSASFIPSLRKVVPASRAIQKA